VRAAVDAESGDVDARRIQCVREHDDARSEVRLVVPVDVGWHGDALPALAAIGSGEHGDAAEVALT
jgi:hypothetical protein